MSDIVVNINDTFPADVLVEMFPNMKFKIQDAVTGNDAVVYYCVSRHDDDKAVGYSVITFDQKTGNPRIVYSQDFDYDKYVLTSIDFIPDNFDRLFIPLLSFKCWEGVPYVSSDPNTHEIQRGILAKDGDGRPVVLDFIESSHYGVKTEIRVKVYRPTVEYTANDTLMSFYDDGYGEYHRGDLIMAKGVDTIYPNIEDYHYDVSVAKSTFGSNRHVFSVGNIAQKTEQLMFELELKHEEVPPREGAYGIKNINPEHGFVLIAYRKGNYLAHNPETNECGLVTEEDIKEHDGFYGKPLVTVVGTPYVSGTEFICLQADGNVINLETFSKFHLLENDSQDMVVGSTGGVYTYPYSDKAFEHSNKKNVAVKSNY